MTRRIVRLLAALMTLAAAPAMAGGVKLTNAAFAQQKTLASDGTTKIALVPARHAVPGDRIVYRLSYRNDETQPVSGIVLNNIVPAGMAYRGPAEGAPEPLVSIDGKSFAPLVTLSVSDAQGHVRAARAEDVKQVRWAVAGAVPPRGTGQFAFEATLK